MRLTQRQPGRGGVDLRQHLVVEGTGDISVNTQCPTGFPQLLQHQPTNPRSYAPITCFGVSQMRTSPHFFRVI